MDAKKRVPVTGLHLLKMQGIGKPKTLNTRGRTFVWEIHNIYLFVVNGFPRVWLLLLMPLSYQVLKLVP